MELAAAPESAHASTSALPVMRMDVDVKSSDTVAKSVVKGHLEVHGKQKRPKKEKKMRDEALDERLVMRRCSCNVPVFAPTAGVRSVGGSTATRHFGRCLSVLFVGDCEQVFRVPGCVVFSAHLV